MWAVAVLFVALSGVSGAFKLYYDKSEAEKVAFATQLQVAVNNQQVLENTIEDQNRKILASLERQKEQQEQMRGLEEQNREANEEVSILKLKFAKHDLIHLSLRKPGLIEAIINKATKRVGADFAEITNPDRSSTD